MPRIRSKEKQILKIKLVNLDLNLDLNHDPNQIKKEEDLEMLCQ